MKRIRYYIFLRDVLTLSVTAFGGPQAHIAMFLDMLVKKRRYLTEDELIELNALCQILPGPTSTQTITAIGFKIGGPNLAYLTLLIWMLPAVIIMTVAALIMSTFQEKQISLAFTRFIQPMAVGFVAYAAYRITRKVVNTKTGYVILGVSALASYFAGSPFVFPLILIVSGLVTGLKFKGQPKQEKEKIHIQWANFFLWGGFFIGIAVLGGITSALPIRLFENFYRNGSLIFGGGQVLIPFLYAEFVEFKQLLTDSEFLTGFALVQSLPGPVFSFSAYVGTLAANDYATVGQIVCGLLSAVGIFLPGTFLIFFVIRFWEQLKKYRVIRASLEGISAGSSGMVIAAAFILGVPFFTTPDPVNLLIIAATFALLQFTKIPAPLMIITGLAAGFIF